MKKIIAFAVVAFALATGVTAVTMTVHPQRAVACLNPSLLNL